MDKFILAALKIWYVDGRSDDALVQTLNVNKAYE